MLDGIYVKGGRKEKGERGEGEKREGERKRGEGKREQGDVGEMLRHKEARVRRRGERGREKSGGGEKREALWSRAQCGAAEKEQARKRHKRDETRETEESLRRDEFEQALRHNPRRQDGGKELRRRRQHDYPESLEALRTSNVGVSLLAVRLRPEDSRRFK